MALTRARAWESERESARNFEGEFAWGSALWRFVFEKGWPQVQLWMRLAETVRMGLQSVF